MIQLSSALAVWSLGAREGGDKREAEKQSLYKPSTLTLSRLLHAYGGLAKVFVKASWYVIKQFCISCSVKEVFHPRPYSNICLALKPNIPGCSNI